MLAVCDLQGLWRRTLLAWPDGRRDETTDVAWLQGPSLYADLRTPPDRPDFSNVASLDDLTGPQIAWLATQEGFAGRFVAIGDVFEWRRELDFQPPGPVPDVGALHMEGDHMVETGVHLPYIEHWRRGPRAETGGALRLSSADDGRPAFLVVAGSAFIFARARAATLEGGTLADHAAAAPDLAAARALIDCEISLGDVDGGAFRIRRSTLPFREGATLEPTLAGDALTFAQGSVWQVTEREGAIAPLTR